jgi:hypothetical protein
MIPEKLTVSELKSRLRKFAPRLKQLREEMPPLLAELRKRMSAQGQKGKGFGAWVEKNLPITRRTADLWADEYEGKRTSRNISKSLPSRGAPRPGEERVYPLDFVVSEQEEQQLIEAVRVLGKEETKRIVFQTLLEAANRKKHVTSRSAKAGA